MVGSVVVSEIERNEIKLMTVPEPVPLVLAISFRRSLKIDALITLSCIGQRSNGIPADAGWASRSLIVSSMQASRSLVIRDHARQWSRRVTPPLLATVEISDQAVCRSTRCRQAPSTSSQPRSPGWGRGWALYTLQSVAVWILIGSKATST